MHQYMCSSCQANLASGSPPWGSWALSCEILGEDQFKWSHNPSALMTTRCCPQVAPARCVTHPTQGEAAICAHQYTNPVYKLPARLQIQNNKLCPLQILIWAGISPLSPSPSLGANGVPPPPPSYAAIKATFPKGEYYSTKVVFSY